MRLLAVADCSSKKNYRRSLNPYSTGNEVVGETKKWANLVNFGLNPYSTGNEVVGS